MSYLEIELKKMLSEDIKSIQENSYFSSLLREFSSFSNDVKHSVTHHIQTKGPLVFAKAPRLSPEKLQIVKKEYENIIQQGIWASSLHFVLK